MTPDAQPQFDVCEALTEAAACDRDPAYFLRRYVFIEAKDDEGQGGAWIKFAPWGAQLGVGRLWAMHRLLLVLKARQLGLTWLFLALLVWKAIFRPGSAIALFSRREKEAKELLKRVKGIVARLPKHFQPASFPEDNRTEWRWSNGSVFMCFPTSAGDSYTFTDALVDEADLCPDLADMLNAVKPTIDGGGSLVLLSKSLKRKPHTIFKRLYRQARQGKGPWTATFLPWSSRPTRTKAWYEAQREHSLAQDGTLDFLHENYPATDIEALSPPSANKRLPSDWLAACFKERDPIPAEELPDDAPDIPGLRVYHLPAVGRRYGAGVDAGQGLATSDDSACVILDEDGVECASFEGKHEPTEVFPEYVHRLALWYGADILPEENNHGHATIGGLRTRAARLVRGNMRREGWLSNRTGKVLLYDALAGAVRTTWRARRRDPDASGLTLHSPTVYYQAGSIEADTLLAPQGDSDDLADALALARMATDLAGDFEHRAEVGGAEVEVSDGDRDDFDDDNDNPGAPEAWHGLPGFEHNW